jgi:hypothetical protein
MGMESRATAPLEGHRVGGPAGPRLRGSGSGTEKPPMPSSCRLRGIGRQGRTSAGAGASSRPPPSSRTAMPGVFRISLNSPGAASGPSPRNSAVSPLKARREWGQPSPRHPEIPFDDETRDLPRAATWEDPDAAAPPEGNSARKTMSSSASPSRPWARASTSPRVFSAILPGARTAPDRSAAHRWVQAVGIGAGTVLERPVQAARTLVLSVVATRSSRIAGRSWRRRADRQGLVPARPRGRRSTGRAMP